MLVESLGKKFEFFSLASELGRTSIAEDHQQAQTVDNSRKTVSSLPSGVPMFHPPQWGMYNSEVVLHFIDSGFKFKLRKKEFRVDSS
jgi:hypothetical protein